MKQEGQLPRGGLRMKIRCPPLLYSVIQHSIFSNYFKNKTQNGQTILLYKNLSVILYKNKNIVFAFRFILTNKIFAVIFMV